MSNRCKGCDTDKGIFAQVPLAVLEASEQRHRLLENRLCLIIFFLIITLVVSNFSWIIYNSQFETVEETEAIVQDSEQGTNNYIGHDGDITNGKTDNYKD